jgi:3-hydroxyisobutyrate dehydrogenase
MGANIARRLQDVGYTVAAVYDRDRATAKNLAAELDSKAPATLAEVTALSTIVITVVSDDAAMRSIFADAGDSLLVAADGKLFVNCATITPSVHESFERGRALLRRLGSEVRYVGKTGTAAKVKALVNMVMNSNTAALAEGLGLGQALGLDLTMLREVFAQTGANSRVLETDGGDMQARMHEVFFSATHAAKDTGIALALAEECGIELPVAEATMHQYEKLVERGFGDLDKSAVAELTFPERGINQAVR